MATTNSNTSLTLQDFFSTTLSSGCTSTDTTIYLNSLPTGTQGFLLLDAGNSTTQELIFYNSKGANFVTVPSVGDRGRGGTTAQSHSSGATVKQTVNADYWKELQNGNALTGLVTALDNCIYDHVVSGGVWTADAAGSTRNASMTALTCYINGRYISIGAVTARSFTASKDTYVDVLDNTDGTGTLVYTEVSNDAASPSLAANSIRIAIITTAAGSIAAAGNINQAQVTALGPTVSSNLLLISDSLGNRIYPRNPNGYLVAHRRLITTRAGGDVAGTDLCVVNIPTGGRNVRVYAQAHGSNTSGGVNLTVDIKEGSTTYAHGEIYMTTVGTTNVAACEGVPWLSAGSHTLKLNVNSSGGTLSSYGSAAGQAYANTHISVYLV